MYLRSQPFPEKLVCCSMQRSHILPVTPGLQLHWPEARSHLVKLFEPVSLQLQAKKRRILLVEHDEQLFTKLNVSTKITSMDKNDKTTSALQTGVSPGCYNKSYKQTRRTWELPRTLFQKPLLQSVSTFSFCPSVHSFWFAVFHLIWWSFRCA